jgi:hypothetical protein
VTVLLSKDFGPDISCRPAAGGKLFREHETAVPCTPAPEAQARRNGPLSMTSGVAPQLATMAVFQV